VPLVTPLFAKVVDKLKLDVPSKLPVEVTSPVVDIVLAVVNPLAVPLKVPVIIPVEKSPLLSLLTIVFGVLSDVAESTFDATVVIVDEITPPTLLTVGKSAVPPKSLANFNLPFIVLLASATEAFVTYVATKAVVAI